MKKVKFNFSNYKLILMTGSMLMIGNIFAQSRTYTVLNENKVSNIADYQAAMDKANFDSYRYINNRRKITFDTGVEIELLSASELQVLNIPVDISKASNYDKNTETNPIYRLGSNGYILAEIQSMEKK